MEIQRHLQRREADAKSEAGRARYRSRNKCRRGRRGQTNKADEEGGSRNRESKRRKNQRAETEAKRGKRGIADAETEAKGKEKRTISKEAHSTGAEGKEG